MYTWMCVLRVVNCKGYVMSNQIVSDAMSQVLDLAYILVHTCIYIYIYIYTYTHTHTHTDVYMDVFVVSGEVQGLRHEQPDCVSCHVSGT